VERCSEYEADPSSPVEPLRDSFGMTSPPDLSVSAAESPVREVLNIRRSLGRIDTPPPSPLLAMHDAAAIRQRIGSGTPMRATTIVIADVRDSRLSARAAGPAGCAIVWLRESAAVGFARGRGLAPFVRQRDGHSVAGPVTRWQRC
jgi:hypothetical protein